MSTLQAGPITSLMPQCRAVYHPCFPRRLCILQSLLLHVSRLKLPSGICSPRVLSNTRSELPLQHRPLSWASVIYETARDLRGVNTPVDIKLRSKAALTPWCPFSPAGTVGWRSRCFQNNIALGTPLPCFGPPTYCSVAWKNVSSLPPFKSRAEVRAGECRVLSPEGSISLCTLCIFKMVETCRNVGGRQVTDNRSLFEETRTPLKEM